MLCQSEGKLATVEKNGLSVGGCLFRIVIWTDFFVILKRDFLGKMVVTDVVVVEVVVVDARLWMWCEKGFLSFSGVIVWGI